MKKIFIIDDDTKIRSIYRSALEMENFSVIEAGNWEDAMPILLQNPDIELVLLDIQMPYLTGEVVNDVIRLYNPSIHVIVFSVFPLEEQRRLIDVADDYFDKADGVNVLLNKVRRLLSAGLPNPGGL